MAAWLRGVGSQACCRQVHILWAPKHSFEYPAHQSVPFTTSPLRLPSPPPAFSPAAVWYTHPPLLLPPRWAQVDRHKYVKLAYHGFEPLSREQRMATYNDSGGRAGGQKLFFRKEGMPAAVRKRRRSMGHAGGQHAHGRMGHDHTWLCCMARICRLRAHGAWFGEHDFAPMQLMAP